MKKPLTIEDKVIDKFIEKHPSEDYAWDHSKIILDGILYYRESIVSDKISTKMTAGSLIKKEPAFDFHFMDDVYRILEEHALDGIYYAFLLYKDKNHENHVHDYKFQIDLNAAYPHILNYERLPIDGELYREEDKNRINFYLYRGKMLKDKCIITDDLADYVRENNAGTVTFLFSTNYQIGSKIGERLIKKAYQNKETKKEVKLVHYGYWQKKFLQYDPVDDCYVRNEKNTHELLMVAIMSQMFYTLLKIGDYIGEGGRFVKDAYHFSQEPDCEKIAQFMAKNFEHYDFRIINQWKQGTEDKHGEIIYQSYPDLPEAPRSHHKKCTKNEA